MEKLFISGNAKFPTLDFDPSNGKFEIWGRSLPENTIDFYNPVLDWLDKYKSEAKGKTTVNVSLEYFNTSSSKLILDIFRKFKEIHDTGKSVEVNWYYEEDDPDLEDQGIIFKEIAGVPMNLVAVKEFPFTFM
ncbi:MAG: DUF1987 domain-containing protein [Bacteroidota bacterium]|jgi:hypothetical protein